MVEMVECLEVEELGRVCSGGGRALDIPPNFLIVSVLDKGGVITYIIRVSGELLMEDYAHQLLFQVCDIAFFFCHIRVWSLCLVERRISIQ